MQANEIIQPKILRGEKFEVTKDEGGFHWMADSIGKRDLKVSVWSDGDEIAWAIFEINDDGETLSSKDTYVNIAYRRQGIATRMYDWARSLGNDIIKSRFVTPAGGKFWKHRNRQAK